jgi:arginyl-tRNA synthetase
MKNDYLSVIFRKSLDKLDVPKDFELIFEQPKNQEFGDISCNSAMQLARILKSNPRKIAEDIISNLQYDENKIENISIAGPGFINIKFSQNYYAEHIKRLYKLDSNIGKPNQKKSEKVIVEYVSVNPTGLLHIGHGRNACIGDTVANLYEWLGYDVTREYYFNNAGNQMQNLAKSIYARYRQIKDENYPFPEDGYHGDYIKTIASEFYNKHDDKFINESAEALDECRTFGEKWCFAEIRKTLNRLSIEQDNYYNEDSLYKEGKIEQVISALQEKDLIYEKEGAKWLKFSKLGLEQDRVIVKSTGEPTYRLPDIAYHIEKFKRNFDLLIDVFGSDHIATIPDVMTAVNALGYDSNKIKVLIHQFVTLTDNGKQIKMSKRTGKSYTLDELLDEVGADVVRFFLIMRSISTHLEFDLSLAREQSDKNPVFYLQYAHARICSLLNKFEESGEAIPEKIDFTQLKSKYELSLIKQIINFEDVISTSAEKMEPHILADYLKETASKFHIFYHECPVLNADNNLKYARIGLSETTKNVIKNGLNILGISAPEKM